MTPAEYCADAERVKRSRLTMQALLAVAELAPEPVPEPALTFLAAAVELLRHQGVTPEQIRSMLDEVIVGIEEVRAFLAKPSLQVVK